jgi:hypothetical protein
MAGAGLDAAFGVSAGFGVFFSYGAPTTEVTLPDLILSFKLFSIGSASSVGLGFLPATA